MDVMGPMGSINGASLRRDDDYRKKIMGCKCLQDTILKLIY